MFQNDRLRVAAVPFTRAHDEVRFSDNAEQMNFSTGRFEATRNERLTVEWEMSARVIGRRADHRYDAP